VFFNLFTFSVPDVTPDAQSQKIEKHPGVTTGTHKVKRLKNILE
jgi:hypothetical protein